jgi:hypothetical protein
MPIACASIAATRTRPEFVKDHEDCGAPSGRDPYMFGQPHGAPLGGGIEAFFHFFSSQLARGLGKTSPDDRRFPRR